jgi:hypothetical protein
MVLGSGIRYLRSGIRKKPIPDPGSRGQKGTGSRIRIRNTGISLLQGVSETLFFFFYRTVHKGEIDTGEMTVNNLATFCQECGEFSFFLMDC